MDLELRAPHPDEMVALHRATQLAFGSRLSEATAKFGTGLTPDRCLAVFDGADIVATAGAHGFSLTVPGGARVPVAGVTIVGVLPTHRRRGILRQMMDAQLDDVARRGEPVAVLTASEASIYERFGYGLATYHLRWELMSEHAVLAGRGAAPDVGGGVRLLDGDDAASVAHEVYAVVAARRVGEVTRDEGWWRDRVYALPEPGKPATFFTAVHDGADGRPDGFARYSIAHRWPDRVASNLLQVEEVQATNADAEAALWDFLFGIDLVGTIQADDRPVDEPLRFRLADPRQLRARQLVDHLWVRVLDPRAAFAARAYAVDDALVVELADAFRPELSGRWRIDGGPGGGGCSPSDEPADLALGAPELGALYLGGISASTLAAAGRLEELRSGAVARADRFFSVQPLPLCSTHF